MKPDVLLAALEQVAESLSIKVTYESIRSSVGPGGLCRVKGERRVIIDKRAGTNDRVATLANALAKCDLSGVEAAESEALELINYYAVRRAS